jgi:excinuclease ABC subunit A
MGRPLSLRGAREHNLRAVDLDLPAGQWIAVVGPSGSGKTSLVFDTIVREGQRRVLGSLSARARQFYGKLGRADVDGLDGLPATVAVGQRTATGSVRSTVGTLTGGLDLLRLLYARRAVDPGGEPLTRSHFSFNHPDGACEACQGVGIEDRVSPERLVADAARSIRAGALAPTLKNGYTVYSQVTVEVMDEICRAHGFDVDTPWQDLDDGQRHVILYGTTALKVPFGKHSIESRMRWEGITARPREEGYYRGLVPVIEETLKRNRNPNVLRFVESVPCAACCGSRLGRPGREAALGSWRLPALLALPARELRVALGELPPSEVLSALRPSLDQRLQRMERLSLGHLALDRTSPTLSGGEAQRLRLAAQLTAGLGRQLVALDEPTLGLHPSEQQGMGEVLDELRDLGNTLLVVEHDPDMVRHADHLVRLGPGAGSEGGEVLGSGPLAPAPRDVAGPLGAAPPRKPSPRTGCGSLALRGATLHNLQDADLELRLGSFHVVMGPSGAGKSSLVFGTLLPALQGAPGGEHRGLEGAPSGGVHAVDARPIGRTPRSTPATWSGLFDLIRKRFAAEPEAVARGFGAGRFSYNNKEGRCPRCEGLGFQRVGLHLLEDLELTCAACAGGRYAQQTLAVRHQGLTVAEVLALTLSDAAAHFADDPPIHAMCRAMEDLGLGYLPLGQASNRLSRGEGQRVKLATLLGTQDAEPSFVLLDEPDRGLHPGDVARLLDAIDALVEAGHTVLAISHHRHVWAAADGLTEVVDGIARPVTDVDLSPLAPVRGAREPARAPDAVHLQGVSTNNLAGVDVSIPHGKLTVIAGVSGSGKTSLAYDTLAAEAWHRFSESLPFQVRRFMRRMPRPELASATGLGPTLGMRPGQARAGERSTVATQSEVGPLLRLLWSRAGTLDGEPCGFTAGHFSTEQALGACLACEGRGVTPRCDVARLVTHPELPLADGALQGSRPGRFFSEPDGQYLATLQAAVGADVDLARPWQALPPEVRRVALEGAGERSFSVRWAYRRGKRSGEHTFEGPWLGLLQLVEREARHRAGSRKAREWRAPLVDEDCGACGGSGLRAAVAQVAVGELTLTGIMAMPLTDVVPALEATRREGPQAAVLERLLPDLTARLEDLQALGLGHLSLGRRSRSLSDGELQRTRLASVIRSGLTGLTLVLDEPASGLHPRDVARLVERLRLLLADGNTVVAVSHRPELLREADQLIELGPGAGVHGGRIVAQGPADEVLTGEGPTAQALRATRSMAARPREGRDDPAGFGVVGAKAHNLRSIDVPFPSSGFVCVTGVSGSGKSSLVFDVLEASARAGAPVACEAVRSAAGSEDGSEDGSAAGAGHAGQGAGTDVDGSDHAAGVPGDWPLARFVDIRSSRDTSGGQVVLTAMGLMAPLQALFAAQAGDSGLPRAAFSFLSQAGRCETCKGSGREDVAMDFMADLALPCPTCDGRRYRDEVLAVRWEGMDVVQVLARPVEELSELLPAGKLRAGLAALSEVGLGYLSLGRRSESLSNGERQRVSLASGLAGSRSPALHLLDEPATGLHESDLVRLVGVFRRLAARGDLIVAAEHRGSLIAAADHRIELGPGSGAAGGRLISPPGQDG